ncbi:MAG: peroxiredoxin [Gemmatimonadota bacterium]
MSEMPQEGRPAPEFALPAHGGDVVGLGDFRGRKHVILFFYPKDDTSGCTREACDFRDAYGELERRDVAVLGVSKDPLDSHRSFASKHGLPFPLLSDAGTDVAERYGVWRESRRYGRTSKGIERTTFLIDKQGILRRVFPKVQVAGHVAEITAAVDELEG